MYRETKSANKHIPNRRRRFWLVSCVLGIAVLFAVIAILEVTNTTYLFHDRKAVPGVIPTNPAPENSNQHSGKTDSNTKDDDDTVTSSGPASSPTSPKQGDVTTSPPPSGNAPLTPFGNFISNHSPNLDNEPAPSAVQSVCNTTAGAMCRIELTNLEGVVKTLADQKTDIDGATYWNWNITQAGLTVGTWKVKVTATLNGKTASASDIQNLEVQP